MKRYTIVAAIVLSVAMLTAGCRSGQNQPTTMPTTMPTTAPTTQATTQPTTQATEPSIQPSTGTELPAVKYSLMDLFQSLFGSTGAGESEPTGQNRARGAMPRSY